ncbi:MAG: polyphosphate kinase 2 family protein [Chloroflexota bacterium]|nr:polyphosphate kinase 2 family protein [Chloroflexota bacterium]
MAKSFVPKPLSRIDLKDFDPDDTDGFDKKSARAELEKHALRLDVLQEMLYAGRKHALLVILQGMDTAGKDGAIKKVFDAVDSQGVRIASFKAPTSDELARDFLWRIHREAPPKGYIGIFNRSQYEDVLIVRVNQLIPRAIWEARYEQINAFEKLLHDSGTRVLKFFLHISKDEQKQRLQERLDDPAKHWKFALGDLDARAQWDEYMAAYGDALTRCNTEYAPWHIVPANKKWFRDLVIARSIVETLESMGLAYPKSENDLSKVVIPD